MATLYKVDGTFEEVHPANGETFTLEEMQGFVGGDIEPIFRDKQKNTVMWGDENALLKQNPIINHTASVIAGFVVFGNVIVTQPKEVE